jgi:pyruvate dehydrogenase E1 component beta subunit
MPAFPADAKALTLAALTHDGPVISLEHRSLYESEEEIFGPIAPARLGEARIVHPGKDITVVASSYLAPEAVAAARLLEDRGISLEVIDPRTIRPLDEATILASIARTGRLIVADCSWSSCGFASEVAALAAEKGFAHLKAPVRRVTLPDCPTPVSKPLEDTFYPQAADIVAAALAMLGQDATGQVHRPDSTFQGPY